MATIHEQEPGGIVREPVRFWFIWSKNGRIPRFAHNTRASADAEAERLALLHPGRKFIVLEAVDKVHTPLAAKAVEEAA